MASASNRRHRGLLNHWSHVSRRLAIVRFRKKILEILPRGRLAVSCTTYFRRGQQNVSIQRVPYTECRSRPDPAGVLAGAFLGGILGNAAGGRGNRGGSTAAGVIAGGAIGAALTSQMDCGDRSYAYQSYSLAFNGGRPGASYQWTNPQNSHRDEMRMLDYYEDEDDFRCAVFTQTVYING